MSTASLVERPLSAAMRRRRTVPVWETAFTCATLFLSANAVVPLVFNPQLGGVSRAISVRDPLSQPVWLLVSLFIIVMLFRFGDEILEALVRNPAVATLCLLAVLSSAWSAVPHSTLQSAIQLTLSTLFGLYVGVRFGVERLVTILAWIAAAILVLSVVFAIALPKYGVDHVRASEWRGVFGHGTSSGG